MSRCSVAFGDFKRLTTQNEVCHHYSVQRIHELYGNVTQTPSGQSALYYTTSAAITMSPRSSGVPISSAASPTSIPK